MAESPVFQAVPSELDFPAFETKILELWRTARIFEKGLEQTPKDAPRFVFYEGPPTANGVPHNGHVLTRVMKDLFPRYRSMCGDRVDRKAGWDTHGLPVEVEVEKDLRIHGKSAILEYGVEPFVARCIDSVFRYTTDWEQLTERIGFWVNLKDAYVTYHRSYVESVWWALGELFDKGLLYQGHKVVWWWAQGGTALSAAEVGLGYKMVDDPSVYVAFPLVDEPSTALVVWTTTPWTLPSNHYAAVRGDCEYQVVERGEPLPNARTRAWPLDIKRLIVAGPRRADLEKKLGVELVVTRTLLGRDLEGMRYVPPFDLYYARDAERTIQRRDGSTQLYGWCVIVEDFVTLDTGTGIVHIAPAFGDDDNRAHLRRLAHVREPERVELLCAIEPDGTFKQELGARYAGRWVKQADRDIIRELSERGRLLFEEQVRHEYPYCWRADADPLIQMARPAWFIRTTSRLDDAIRNSQAVNFIPEHIKEGRFGDFLRNNVDWALSRERYWGTPLNVWICEADPEHRHAPRSTREILERNPRAFEHFDQAKQKDPGLSEHLIVHKPWIDQVSFPCPTCGATMRRVPEVIDCWFDSGCMPFAQWGFPHAEGSLERFREAFPADFISEAIDQTRGWFYSLLMISSLVFDEGTQKRMGLGSVRPAPHPYKTCIVLGHVCDREGKKESKSRGNYTPPEVILDRVQMDFAVLEETCGEQGGWSVAIAPEDLEGMDLGAGAVVDVSCRARPEVHVQAVIAPKKGLPRRVVALSPGLADLLGASPALTGLDTRPVEVPRLPVEQRVTLWDLNTPAPGADAFRWFFYASSPPYSNTRHSLKNVRSAQREFLIKLRHVYQFFVIYGTIDGWSPRLSEHAGPVLAERPLLDRFIMSELSLVTEQVRRHLDVFAPYEAAQALIEFVETLSNWYVRRSRERFWASGLGADKRAAYSTLYEVLVTTSKLIAPFVPFFAEEMYQNLVVGVGIEARQSVHHECYPEPNPQHVDRTLASTMRAVRQIVSLGLSVRTRERLKVRQPLSRVDVVLNEEELREAVLLHRDLIAEELNVHEVRLMLREHEAGAIRFRIKPNFRALGPRLGKEVQAVKALLATANPAMLHAELARTGRMTLALPNQTIALSAEEVEVAVEAEPGFAAETGPVAVVVLHTALTPELIDEGLLREVLSRIQAARKDQKLEFSARIDLDVEASPHIASIILAHQETIRTECLVEELRWGKVADGVEVTLSEHQVRFQIRQRQDI